MNTHKLRRFRFRIILATAALGIAGMANAGTASYRAVVLADAPIVYYEFDETSGTTAANSATTGAAYTGSFNTGGGSVAVGQSSFAQGGTAYDFGGGFIGAAAALTNSLDEWTVEAWVNYDAVKTSASNYLSNDQGGWNNDVLIGIGAETGTAGVSPGHVGAVQQSPASGPRDATGAALVAGEWQHVVMTGSTATGALTVYIDSIQVAQDTSLNNGVTFNGADGIGTANLTIGAARPNHTDGGYRPYDGLLDEVAIYDSVLDAATIASHFNAGSSTAGTPPVIATLSPTDDAGEVALSSDLVASFSEPIVLTATGTVTIRNLTLGSGSDLIISLPNPQVTVSGTTLTINPSTNLALDTHYAVQISADALEDVSGDPFVGILNDNDWSFTTVAELDITPPQVVTTVPADDSANADPAAALVATFDEPLAFTGTGSVTIRNLTAGSESIITLPDGRATVSGADLTVNPSADLSEATDYAVRISGNAIEDLAGNVFVGITNDTTWNFTIPAAGTLAGLTVTTYAPDATGLQLKWPTHIAFGPGAGEVITDLKNNRFIYRDGPNDAWQASPMSVSGPHSLVHNPADGLYYANDTANHRIIAFSDLSSGTIAAQTSSIAGVALNRPHDILRDPATGWIYALNPNSGHVFRFTAIGQNESAVQAPTGGYARAISLVNGKIYVIGSSKGRIVEITDWDTPTFTIYDSYDPSGSGGSAGSWTRTGLILNDAEFFEGAWYATSYFSESFAAGTDFNENKFIRFETFDDFETGNWEDLSDLVPSGMNPYFLTSHGGSLYLAIFNHESAGNGDAILRFTPVPDDFNSWISDPSFGLDPSEQGFAFDPDGDRLANGLEAWFGTHPGQFNAGLTGLSTDGINTTFTHPQGAEPPSDISGFYQWSLNLDDWYASDGLDGPIGGPTVTILPDTVGTTTTVISTASEALDRLFLRAGATQQ